MCSVCAALAVSIRRVMVRMKSETGLLDQMSKRSFLTRGELSVPLGERKGPLVGRVC